VATVQVPFVQPAVAFASEQILPQLPQLFGSVAIETSHPSAGLLLQSAYPARHVVTEHVPLLHTSFALLPAHTVPQAPQLLGSLLTSVHVPLQDLVLEQTA
jgi:hypothetical protein